MKSQYSELNFGLGETLDMLREQVNGFAAAENRTPAPKKSTATNEFPHGPLAQDGRHGPAGHHCV